MKIYPKHVQRDIDFYHGQDSAVGFQMGMRLFADALGLRFDPYRSCTNWCAFCFARVLSYSMAARSGVKLDPRIARIPDMKGVAKWMQRILVEGNLKPYWWADWALSQKFYVEVGCLGEPMQPPDVRFRVTWNLMQLLKTFDIPMYLNTKANLLVYDEDYYQAFLSIPRRIIDLSLISDNDEKLGKLVRKAPTATERFTLAERLSKDGVPVIISCRPIIAGVSDDNWERYIQRCVDVGAKSIHLRTLIVIGKLAQRKLWRDHINEFGMEMHSGEYRYPKSYFVDLFNRAREIAEPHGCHLVGTRRYWFDLGGYHGKAAFDYFPQDYQDRLFPYTIVPILRTIAQNADKPQLLLWGKLGFKNTTIPELGLGMGQDMLIFNDCFTRKYRRKYVIAGDDWLRLSLWDDFVPIPKRPGRASEIGRIDRIYPVLDKDGMCPQESGSVMAYIPPGMEEELVQKIGNRMGVPEKVAKEFLVPERKVMYVPPVS